MMKTLLITALAAASVACATEYTTTVNASSKNKGVYTGFTLSLGASYLTTAPNTPDGTVYLTGMTLAINSDPSSGALKQAASANPYVKIAVYDSKNTLLGLSSAIDVSLATVEADPGKVQSLTFGGGVEVDFSSTYKFVFVAEGSTMDSLKDQAPSNVAVKAGISLYGSVSGASNVLYTNTDLTTYQDGNYTPLVTFTTSDVAPAVPEPATATLSLLALAGLAARRRCK